MGKCQKCGAEGINDKYQFCFNCSQEIKAKETINQKEVKQNEKYKNCPFKENFSCSMCELLMPNIDMCVFKCINSNLGLLAKTLAGDTKTVEKIKKDLMGGEDESGTPEQ